MVMHICACSCVIYAINIAVVTEESALPCASRRTLSLSERNAAELGRQDSPVRYEPRRSPLDLRRHQHVGGHGDTDRAARYEADVVHSLELWNGCSW